MGGMGVTIEGSTNGAEVVSEFLLPISTPIKKRRMHNKQKQIAMIATMRWVKVKVYCITQRKSTFMEQGW